MILHFLLRSCEVKCLNFYDYGYCIKNEAKTRIKLEERWGNSCIIFTEGGFNEDFLGAATAQLVSISR